MIQTIILVVAVVAMYIIIYKYEKKMEKMQELIDSNTSRIDDNHEKIKHNNNHIEKLWIAHPKKHTDHEEEKKEGNK